MKNRDSRREFLRAGAAAALAAGAASCTKSSVPENAKTEAHCR